MKNPQRDWLLKTSSVPLLGTSVPVPNRCEQTHGNSPCSAAAKDTNPLIGSISRALYNKRRPETSTVINTFLVTMPSASGFPLGSRRSLILNESGAALPSCCISSSSFSFVGFNSITLLFFKTQRQMAHRFLCPAASRAAEVRPRRENHTNPLCSNKGVERRWQVEQGHYCQDYSILKRVIFG